MSNSLRLSRVKLYALVGAMYCGGYALARLTNEPRNMLLKQGAEAKIHKSEYLGCPCVVKERFVKKYRHPELDAHLTKERIKAECRAIVRCKAAGICTPTLYGVDLAKRCIYMEYIDNAKTLKDCISNAVNNTDHANGNNDCIGPIFERIGSLIGRMHSSNIIHGDLTTSNILLVGDLGSEDLRIIFIDFGLSSADESAEDKGVDLYVLERAIISAHAVKENVFDLILKAYAKEYKKGSSEVLRKLDEVRSRGRKRLMVG